MLIAVHCEDEGTIKANLEQYKAEYGENIPVKFHHLIRSRRACYLSSSRAIELAKKDRSKIACFPFVYSKGNGVVYQ